MPDALKERNEALRGALQVVNASIASVSQAELGDNAQLMGIMGNARDLHVAAYRLEGEARDKLHALAAEHERS